MKKYIFFALLIIFGIGILETYKNFHLFVAKFEKTKLRLVEKKIIYNNNKIKNNLDSGFYTFKDEKFTYKEYPLEKFGVKFPDFIDLKPIGYFDSFEDKIIFMSNDGNIYSTNNIAEIKKGKFLIKKLSNFDEKFKLDNGDENSYRNIKIRDILINDKNIYVVSNDREKKNDDEYYASIKVFKGDLTLEGGKINFQEFYSTNEKFISNDWSHTGGRLVYLGNEEYLLSVADFQLDYPILEKKVFSDNSIAGKTILIGKDKSEIFSKGHRNIQGLFYDKKNKLVFSSEHGPTGGDEINIIEKDINYGWPKSSYGTLGYEFENHPRKHKKYGFKEPLYYWWPFNCAPSEITFVSKDFVKNWDRSLLVSCLSGNNLNGKSIIRFVYDAKNKKLFRKKQHYIGDRIRDIKYFEKDKVLVLLLEGKKSLAFIYKK